jgi:1-acyl-sn-glycerol-3-phosphate acyltransferase
VRSLLGHRYLRRLVTLPALFALFALFVAALPLWVLAAAAISPRLPGTLRPLRWLWVLAVYLVLQVVGVVVVGVLWLASGFGTYARSPRFRSAHYRVLGTLLSILMRAVRWAFQLRLVLRPASPRDDEVASESSRPLLVMSRHAGAGDSLLVVNQLMATYGRRPRIVLKNTLQWDPVFDMLLNHLPTRFISTEPGAGSNVPALIAELASDLSGEDALVIFPEGGNFTERRRQRSIDRLEAAGFEDFAGRARSMTNVMAPRPGGSFAAVDAAPQADVMFVVHTGLERLSTFREIWRGFPMGTDVSGEFWIVAAEDVPEDQAARMDWLYREWERMDAWIAQHSALDT